MKIPNFLIIGAPKAGTTTLYNFLKQHPQIYMSPLKEPHFFSYGCDNKQCPITNLHPITNLKDYCALFRKVSNEIAIGEASNSYLGHLKAPERIRHHIPNAKLIAILRDPADGAYSKFLMEYRQNFDVSNNSNLIDDFAQAIQKSLLVRGSGLYYKKLKRYITLFDRHRIKVCLFKDLKTDPDSLLRDIFQFLDVEEKFCVDKSIVIYNAGGVPRTKFIYTSLEKLRQNFNITLKPLIPEGLLKQTYTVYSSLRNFNLVEPPPLPLEMRSQLIEIFQEDILQLQDLIQRDLSSWLKSSRE